MRLGHAGGGSFRPGADMAYACLRPVAASSPESASQIRSRAPLSMRCMDYARATAKTRSLCPGAASINLGCWLGELIMPSTLPALHLEFVERVRNGVGNDRRLTALLAGGSYIHGGFDDHSDLDFVIVVKDESYIEVMASRYEFAEGLGDLLAAFTGEHVGEPRLLICLHGPPLIHVDLKFVLQSDLSRLVERPAVLFARDSQQIETCLDEADIEWPNASPEWFEQRAWIWLHYGATKLARGELFEAMGILAFFREQVLGPLLHRRAGRPQRGVRRLEALGELSVERLARTVPAFDKASVRDSLLIAVDMYIDLRADDPPSKMIRHMPEAIREYLSTNG